VGFARLDSCPLGQESQLKHTFVVKAVCVLNYSPTEEAKFSLGKYPHKYTLRFLSGPSVEIQKLSNQKIPKHFSESAEEFKNEI
jgi:hypothetical protein